MARQHRFKSLSNDAVYHCISRTINGEYLFDDEAKEILRKHLHQAAEFSGVKLVTYALMTNHFHVVVRIPEQGSVSDDELIRRYKVLHPKTTEWSEVQLGMLETILKAGGDEARKLRERLLRRMNNLSEFMKTFKHRFAVWFNKSHKRFGHLWAERFTSTIIEGNHHHALQVVAAYVDLNPVRAGIVKDPKDYRWSGYGEAVATGGTMLGGLRSVLPDGDTLEDATVLANYRMKLFGKGSEAKRGDSKAAKISAEAFAKVAGADGHLNVAEHLRIRMSWVTWGAVIGGEQFVSEHLKQYRLREKRRHHIKPRPFEAGKTEPLTDLFAMRSRK
ncbi:MAG: transposase [Puniceicoccales bacterium]|jgi:REP element-mobilizing transposase RayT|nr:transposase [Puniceicoccales bacterium]